MMVFCDRCDIFWTLFIISETYVSDKWSFRLQMQGRAGEPTLVGSSFIWRAKFWDCMSTGSLVIFMSNDVVVKVKCTLVQALRLCTGHMAHRGSRGIALPIHDHDTRRGWGLSVMPRPLFTPGKDPVPIVQEVGWAPGPVWTGAENLAPTGIRSPDRPAHSQSLYWLRYPGPLVMWWPLRTKYIYFFCLEILSSELFELDIHKRDNAHIT